MNRVIFLLLAECLLSGVWAKKQRSSWIRYNLCNGHTKHAAIIAFMSCLVYLYLFISCFIICAVGQTVDDPCITLSGLIGSINGTFTENTCWRIVPYVGKGHQPTSISIKFSEFSLGPNKLTVYEGNSPTGTVYNDFTGGSNPVTTFVLIYTNALFLFLDMQSDDCSFEFDWSTGDKKELKTALVVLISVICVRVAICTQSKKVKQKQLLYPNYGTRRRLVGFWSGLALGFLIMVLLLSRSIHL